MLTVEVTIPGSPAAISPVSIPLPPGISETEDMMSLRSLVNYIVQKEVAAFRQRQEERSILRVLTSREIQEGLVKGKVTMGGNAVQYVDPDEAVSCAIQAFVDGLYFVFIDGEQQFDIDGQVRVRRDSKITFIKLVALAGG